MLKGLDKDHYALLQPEGTYRDLKNGRFSAEKGVLETEPGTRHVAALDHGYAVVHHQDVGEKGGWRNTVLFLADDNGNRKLSFFKERSKKSEDGTYECKLDPIAQSPHFGFEKGDHVESTYRVNQRGETILYWTDGRTRPKQFNIEAHQKASTSESPTFITGDTLSLFPSLSKAAEIDFDEIQPFGGSLKSGVYHFALAYVGEDGAKTNFFYVSQGIPVYPEEGGLPDTPTSKAVRFTVNGLDRQYKKLRIAVIKGTSVELLPDIAISSSEAGYLYTGSETAVEASLEDVLIDRISYKRAKALEQQNDTLYLGNLASEDEIDYQKYANGIEVNCVSSPISDVAESVTGSGERAYEDPNVLSRFKTYQRDEVYALYISFLLKNGSETRAFHIPGRRANGARGGDGHARFSIEVQEGSAPSSAKTGQGTLRLFNDLPAEGQEASGGGGILSFTSEGYEGESGVSGTFAVELIDAQDTVQRTISFSVAASDTYNIVLDKLVREINGNPRVQRFGGGQTGTFDEEGRKKFLAKEFTDNSGVTLRATRAGEDLNGWRLRAKTNLSNIVFLETGTVTSGGSTPDQALPNDVITFSLFDGNSFDIEVTGLYGTMPRAEYLGKLHDALLASPAFTSRFDATRNGDPSDETRTDAINITTLEQRLADNAEITTRRKDGEIANARLQTFDVEGARAAGEDYVPGFTLNVDGEHSNYPIPSNLSSNELLQYLFDNVESEYFKPETIVFSSPDKPDQEWFATDVNEDVELDGKNKIVFRSVRQSDEDNVRISLEFYDTQAVATPTDATGGGLEFGDERSLYFDQEGVYEGARQFHLLGKPDEEHNMAYWENENERYPDSEEWDVWRTDAHGNGVQDFSSDGTPKTLRGERVRHHHLPENLYEPYIVFEAFNGFTTSEVRVLGLKLTNVQIPADIKERVTGYKIHFARKTPENRTILDQGTNVYGARDRNYKVAPSSTLLIPNAFPQKSIPGYGDYDLFEEGEESKYPVYQLQDHSYFHPFTLMRRRHNVASLSHLKLVNQFVYKDDATEDVLDRIEYEPISKIRRIFAAAYVEQGDRNIDLSPMGFNLDMMNTYSEAKLVVNHEDVKVKESGGFSGGEGNPEYQYVANLCQLRRDVHNAFDLQELVWTGYLETDLDKTASEVFYGGDIRIAENTFKASFLTPNPRYSGFHPNDETGETIYLDYGYLGRDNDYWYHNGPEDGINDPESVNAYFDADIGRVAAFGKTFYEIVETRSDPALRYRGQEIYERFEGVAWNLRPDYEDAPVKATTGLEGPELVAKAVEYYEMFWNNFDNFFNVDPALEGARSVKAASARRKNSFLSTNYPTRIVRSQQFAASADADADFQETGFRSFLANDFLDLPKNRGELVSLRVVQNILVPHLERAIVRTRGREELAIDDVRAFIGTGDIFAVTPSEIVTTDLGFAGCQTPGAGTISQYGYFFPDVSAGKVFCLSDGIKEISKRGLEQFFEEELNDPSEEYISVFDEENDRTLFTKKGAWTLSYYHDRNMWCSFYDFNPDYYLPSLKGFYSIKNGVIYAHDDENNHTKFYNSDYPFSIQFVENEDVSISKRVKSLYFDTEVRADDGDEIIKQTFDLFRIENGYQDTGFQEILNYDGSSGNVRRIQGRFNINAIRDVEGEVQTGLPSWASKSRLVDKFHIVTLVYNNELKRKFYMIEAGLHHAVATR